MSNQESLVLTRKKWQLTFLLIPLFFIADVVLEWHIIYTRPMVWYNSRSGILLFAIAVIVLIVLIMNSLVKITFYDDYVYYGGIFRRKKVMYEDIAYLDYSFSTAGQQTKDYFKLEDKNGKMLIKIKLIYLSGLSGGDFIDEVRQYIPHIDVTTYCWRNFKNRHPSLKR